MSGIAKWHAAAALAARLHDGQRRKDGATPYAAHPARVALVIATIFGVQDEDILAAALLHDVIEDSPADYDDIEEAFGPAVAKLVAAMTKDMRRPEREREALYDAQLAHGPWQARLIKLADVYDNLADAGADARDRHVEKARRALALAAEDPELEQARRCVQQLVDALGGAE